MNARREVDLATNATVAGRRGQAVRVLAGTGRVLGLEAAEGNGARVVDGLVVLAEHRVTGNHAEALQRGSEALEVLDAQRNHLGERGDVADLDVVDDHTPVRAASDGSRPLLDLWSVSAG